MDQPGLNPADHDLLLKLSENVSALRNEVRDVTQRLGSQLSDHEARLRLQEAATDRNEGAWRMSRWLIAASSVLLLSLQAIILWMHK